MTQDSPGSPDGSSAGDDQKEHAFGYGHGRMPAFMKVVWLAFLAFATWYVVQYLLTSLGEEVGK